MSNIDNILNLEKRTGVRDGDIDQFLEKATALEEAIRGLRDGTIDPRDPHAIKIEGIDCDTDEERALKKIEKEAVEEKRRQAAYALGLQRKNEEKELWWAGAEMHHTNKSGKDKDTAMQEIDCDPHNSSSEKENIMKKYISDYSRWDEWVPKDPATLLEQQEETKKKEQGDTEQFEKNNAEFCQQFLDDMKERNKVLEKKKEGADVLRLRGNNAFKKKDYNSALSIYKDSLRSMPYTDKTLLNIAQCYIKLSEFEDAIEFLSRVLYLDDTNAKAWNRKAFVLKEQGALVNALECSQKAVTLDPTNADILSLHVDLECSVRSQNEELELSLLPKEEKMALKVVDAFIAGVGEFVSTTETGASLPVALIESIKSCILASKENVHLQVYFRISGALKLAVDICLKCAVEEECALVVELLCSNVVNQKTSIALLFESGLVSFFINRISTIPDAHLIGAAICRLLLLCCSEASSSAARTSILGDKHLIISVAHLIKSILLAGPANTAWKHLESYIRFLNVVVFSSEGKEFVEFCPEVVGAAGGVVGARSLPDTIIEAAIELLVGCSQLKGLRQSFLQTPPGITNMTVAGVVASSLRLDAPGISNALALLINITFETPEVVREEIIAVGALKALLPALNASEDERDGWESGAELRSLNLLSRLAGSDRAQKLLFKTDSYRALCRRLAAAAFKVEAGSETHALDVCANLVKILACLSGAPAECRVVAKEQTLVKSLLMLFPIPREELGEITPSSVTLIPKVLVPSTLIGNAARCLMPLADDDSLNTSLYLDTSLKGIEKLICSMATCTDMRVRKNIAILLAKGCTRIPTVREKVKMLRGLEMLVELQDKL